MPRIRRWAKKLGLVVLELFVVVTVASVAYNLATADRVKPASAFYDGPLVGVDGKVVAYRRGGVQGTPVVLLGGFIVPSSVWEGVGRRLARRHRVFAIDLPPFGYTERKGPYTLESWVHLVHDFDRRLGLHGPLLVGHSLGAVVVVAGAAHGRGVYHPPPPRGRGRDGRSDRRGLVSGQLKTMIGRTSRPPCRTGTSRAISIAASRSRASTR